MNWPVAPLSTALDRIETGRSPKAQERPASAGEFGVLKLSAISWGSFDPSENKALFPDTDPNGCPCLSANDLLMSRANTKELVGAVVLVDRDYPNLLLSDKTLRLVPKPQVGHSRFLLYALRTPSARKHIERCATGTSFSMRNISQEKIAATPIPLPPLAEQRRIAEVLDRADALRAKRRAALTQLDTLTQSLFLDLFGDSTTNPNAWTIKKLGDLVSEFRYGSSNKSANHGKPALRIPNVAGGSIDLTDLKLVPVDAAEFERLRLRDGDLLFVRTNGNPDFVGRCAVFDCTAAAASRFGGEEFIFASYLIRARLAATNITPLFLREYLLGVEGRRQLRSRSKTSAGQFNINTESLAAIPVPLPPLSLQSEFARQVGSVEKLKTSQRSSLAELDALFASLQHRAFRGEL